LPEVEGLEITVKITVSLVVILSGAFVLLSFVDEEGIDVH
jgi:hypothetical protein